jgi:dienelactone hydrolase
MARDLTDDVARLAPHLKVFKPEGEGPFPVCLQFHGCGGIFAMQFDYAESARRAGIAIVVVDSFAPRAIGRLEAQATVCTGLRFRGGERAVDVLAALRWLEAQPWADQARIAAAGWSHGAWALMEALAGTPAQSQGATLPLQAAVLFYPYCGPPSRTLSRGWGAHRPKVYGVVGGRDVVVGRRLPERAFRRLKTDGLSVRTLFLEEAAHCFDEQAPGAPPSRFRPDLAEIARAFYVDALKESLGVQASSQTTPALASV